MAGVPHARPLPTGEDVRRRTVLAATAPAAVLALTATACGGSEKDGASDKPGRTAAGTGR